MVIYLVLEFYFKKYDDNVENNGMVRILKLL